jgi:hypothetical protein
VFLIRTASQKADYGSVLVVGQEQHGDPRGRVLAQGQADESIDWLRSDMEAAVTPIYVSLTSNVGGGASMLMTRLFPLSRNRNTSSVSLRTRGERAQDWGKGRCVKLGCRKVGWTMGVIYLRWLSRSSSVFRSGFRTVTFMKSVHRK